jgi:oxygen-dependent protoporphyrinogen oxidase
MAPRTKLHALERRGGSLVRGAILAARERRASGAPRKPPMQSFAFAGGLQALTDALAAGIGAVALSTRATALELTAPGLYTVRAEHAGQALAWSARAVVLAVPADAAATLLRPLAPDAAAALDSIEYAPVATVASAYRAADIAHALDGFGCLMPALERRRALGVLFSSSMFEGRAPQGTALLTTFIGGRRNPDLPVLDEGAIAAVAQGEHAALLGARAAPLWQAVTRWPRAIPQYDIGHLQRVARAAAAETSLPGVHLCANWRGGVSVGDCVDNGHALGERLAAQLRAPA